MVFRLCSCTALRFLVLTLALLSEGGLLCFGSSKKSPQFSWRTVPVFAETSNISGVFDDSALRTLAKFPLFVAEKAYDYPANGYAEDKLLRLTKRLRALNPNITLVFYYNANLDLTDYRLHAITASHRPNWWLRNSSGSVFVAPIDGGPGNRPSFPYNANGGGVPVFDFTVPAMRRAWVQECLNMTSPSSPKTQGFFDGCMVDRWDRTPFHKHRLPPGYTRAALERWTAGRDAATSELAVYARKSSMYLVGEGDNVSAVSDPGYGGGGKAALEQQLQHAAHGVGVLASYKPQSNASRFISQLAKFLVGAAVGHYFGAGSWTVNHTSREGVSWHDEYDLPLGPPLGNAEKMDDVWYRRFAFGTNVTYNEKQDSGTIEWGTFPPTAASHSAGNNIDINNNHINNKEICAARRYPNTVYNGSVLARTYNVTVDVCCSACAKNEACLHFTHHPLGSRGQPPVCYLQRDDGDRTPSSANRGFSSGDVSPSQHRLCSTDLDCSLAGECVDGKCVCDGWTHGDHCEILSLLPADPKRPGYRNSTGYNSWGGGTVRYNNTWYLFVSQIAGKCPLDGYWSSLSEAVRLESDHPMGPWARAETVIPSFAHNVKPFQAPDGSFVIYYVGGINNSTRNCTNSLSESSAFIHSSSSPLPKEAAGPIWVAHAPTADAAPNAWSAHGPMTDSAGWHSATNPSPVFASDGSVRMAVSRRWDLGGGRATKNNFIMEADSWAGPYHNITKGFDQAIKNGEDPDMFKTKRGWHMLNHNTGPSSSTLSYSVDGIGWKTVLAENAFNATVQWTNGSRTEFCRRQRPQIVFADDGMPGWLWSGVMDGPADGKCEGKSTWTFVQQIGRPKDMI